jgi:hypothetical protein
MKLLVSVTILVGVFLACANGCSSMATNFDPCPGELTCPNGVCCPIGYPFDCNGKCYQSAAGCGSSYVTCSGSSGGGSGASGGNGNTGTGNGGCASGTAQCGTAYCSPIGDVCCASAGHPELSCSAGATCNSDGTCSGGSGGGGGGGGGGGTGVPCSQNVHPAWMAGECQPVTTCKCTLQACVRVANGGCCSGYDLGWIFIPCNGSGGTSCGDCQAAATSALQQCGCNP